MVIAEPAQPLVAADEQTQPAVEDDAADVAKRPLGGAEGGERCFVNSTRVPGSLAQVGHLHRRALL